jgi:hypothetical protein
MKFKIGKYHTLIIGILAVSIILGVPLAIAAYQASIAGTITVVGVGLTFYSDSQGSNQLSVLAVGNINNGTSITKTVYMKNTGNIAKGYSMSSSGLPAGVTVSWNREGYSLTPNIVISADIIFTASATAPQSIANKTFNLLFA